MSSSATPGLREITVCCNQCGSANLLRLDRREYRCNHCGSITVVSDDADRFQMLVREGAAGDGKVRATHEASRLGGLPVAGLVAFAVLMFAVLVIVVTRHVLPKASEPVVQTVVPPLQQGTIGARGSTGSSSATPLPAFNTRLLIAKAPRHLLDEKGRNIYIGEVTNTSPNLVALAPEVTLVLRRQGREVAHADRSYADLVPGVHVPVFFHYDDGAATSFDEASLLWEPTKAYRLGGPGHARLTTEVTNDLVPRGHGRRTTIEVTGRVRNVGDVAAGASVYAVLRDTDGFITGYAHGDIPGIAPGEFDNVRFVVYVNGSPAVRVELFALPQKETVR